MWMAAGLRTDTSDYDDVATRYCVAVIIVALTCSSLLAADSKQSVVILSASATTPQKKAAQMLVEEIEKRTQLRLKIVNSAPSGVPTISLGLGGGG
jgi:TRAP-type C4-dicarboxylate transport system substrate-binding protein